MLLASTAAADTKAPSIVPIDSATATKEVALRNGKIYFGETIIYTADADGKVQFGVWEADASKTKLIDYPFTEYVLMLSGVLAVTNDDGTSREYKAGDTFVIPKGFTGIWHVRERMKKQHIKIGDPAATTKSEPLD